MVEPVPTRRGCPFSYEITSFVFFSSIYVTVTDTGFVTLALTEIGVEFKP